MLKRYFNTFDKQGWVQFILGSLLFILTCLLTVYVFRDFSKLVAVLLAYLGLEESASLVGRATLGSIYRHKYGKNKDMYLANKGHLDERFKVLYRGESDGKEEKDAEETTNDGSKGTKD